jgi:uncharacterized protein (TIRG00374 family)
MGGRMGPLESLPSLRRARRRRRLRRWLHRVGPAVVGVGAIGGIVVILNPGQVGGALSRFKPELIPALIGLYVAIYCVQGLRWHYLLRDAGAELRTGDSLLLNAAGQTVTALVPLGDLTRALFAAEASGLEFGTVAATVTVQELTYTMMLVLLALPMLIALHLGVTIVVATLVGMAGIVVILTVSQVFCAVHRIVARIPLLNRLLPAIDELQHETADLLHRPDALGWSVLDLARAVLSVTVFWVVVWGLSPGSITWWEAAFVLAVSSIGGAISLVPGGVGANEAGVAGLLLLLGVGGGPAGAAALLQRVLMTGMALLLGLTAYAVARRRFKLGGVFQITVRERPARAA